MSEGIIRHFTEREFWPAFRADLLECSTSLVILSPFLARARAFSLIREFRRLRARGVRVLVYTRPAAGQAGGLGARFQVVVRALRSSGVEVRERERMHEKVVAIDGRVFWHGSLNVLSHSATFESMLRIESEDLVRSVLADLGIVGFEKRGLEPIAAAVSRSKRATRGGDFRGRR